MKLRLGAAILTVLAIILVSGCTGAAPSPSPTPTPSPRPTATPSPTATSPPSPTTTTPPSPVPPSAPTAGQLASSGQAVYASQSAACHGDKGQGVTGPTLWGASASLDKYKTGKGLYGFISTVMPLTAPGSLSPEQYLQVVSYLLLQNNYVSSNTPIDQSKLDSITLK